MSINQPDMNYDWTQPPRPGMSGGTKLLLGIGIGAGLVVLICCGGVAVFLFYMQSYVQDMISDDPATVVAKTKEIAQLDIPGDLKPAGSFDMKVPFADQRVMVWVAYHDEDSNSLLVLAAFGEAFDTQHQADIHKSIEQSLQKQGMAQDDESFESEETYTRELTIRDKPTTFNFVKGKDTESESVRIQVTGTFEGKQGTVMVLINADAEKYSEEKIVEMLESVE